MTCFIAGLHFHAIDPHTAVFINSKHWASRFTFNNGLTAVWSQSIKASQKSLIRLIFKKIKFVKINVIYVGWLQNTIMFLGRTSSHTPMRNTLRFEFRVVFNCNYVE